MYKIRVIIVLILLAAMIFTMPIFANAAESEARIIVNVNGIAVRFTQDSGFPFIDPNNRTLVPLRITMEAYGCDVGWDNINKIATVSKGEKIVHVPIGKNYILIDGQQTPTDTTAQVISGRTFLPIRSVLEAFGATVGWDASTSTVKAINPTESITYEIAMLATRDITNAASSCRSTWEEIVSFATLNGKAHAYYLSEEDTTSAILESVRIAVEKGAKIIVAPGFAFSEPVFLAQDMYPDALFVLLDEYPRSADYSVTKTRGNTVGITYKEEHAGYLAGYAIVKEGYTNLGFMGGIDVVPVVEFGYGFIQGAQDAATELNIKNVSIKYHYSGTFWETPEVQAMASSWYAQGVDVIFAAAGMAGRSVMTAAEAAGKYVIGVDNDQSKESSSVLTSAMKDISTSAKAMLASYYAGQFPGGQSLLLGAETYGVQLPMATSRFKIFSQADYDAIFEALANGTVQVPSSTTAESPTQLSLPNVTITLIQ